MRWLITGGCGFIGRSLISRLVGRDDHIKVLDNLAVGTRSDLAEVADFVEHPASQDWTDDPLVLCVGDIRDKKIVSTVVRGADVVVHLAANTGVEPSVLDPIEDFSNNALGTLNILEAVRKNAGARLVFASSGAPLGVQEPPLHEGLAPRPASPYGASKLAGEGYCSAYYHSFGVEAVALRFGNVYGPLSGHKMSIVAKFIKRALDEEVIEIYGDGSQTRDFIYIADLVDAIFKASTVDGIGGEIFQIATSRETTIYELTETLIELLVNKGVKKPKIIFGDKRTGDVVRNFADTAKAEARLNWRAATKLTDGLALTVDSFLG